MPFYSFTISPEYEDFKWPNLSEILAAQAKYKEAAPKEAAAGYLKLLRIKEATWIKNEANELKQRLLTIAHTGSSGRRGVDPTWHALRKEFYWTDKREDVRNFFSACRHCMISRSGNKVPCPL